MVSLPFEDGGGRITTKADPALVKALARAFRYQKLLDERGYRGTLLRLTLLAPEFFEAPLNGRQPEEVTLPRLLEGVPIVWGEQEVDFTKARQ